MPIDPQQITSSNFVKTTSKDTIQQIKSATLAEAITEIF
jgi:hypothetical protein